MHLSTWAAWERNLHLDKKARWTNKIFMYAERDWEFVSFSAIFPSEEEAQGVAVGSELK